MIHSKHRQTKTTKRNRIGAATVEFAICAQVAFAVIFAAVEFSRLHVMRNLAQDAAYYAARNAMVPGATEAEAIATAEEILGYLNTQDATIVVNNNAGLSSDDDQVTVRVTVPMANNVLFLAGLSRGVTFEVSATMRTERYDGYFDPSVPDD